MKRIALIIVGSLCFLAATGSFLYFHTSTVENGTRSGFYFGRQLWSGKITITGDTLIVGGLTIEPGTTVAFAEGDDRSSGEEVPPDGFNDADPTRLLSYAETHGNISVVGKVYAVGTEEMPITFTSASASPRLADWEAIIWSGNGSIFDHVVVEYTRNGLNPVGDQPDSVIKDSIVRHCMWGCISTGHSPVQVLGNHISDCGHEGVDVQGGTQIIKGNLIEECQGGIVILEGSPTVEDNVLRRVGGGIHVAPGATPKLSNNVVELYPHGTEREWRYGDFAYKLRWQGPRP